MRAVGSQPMSTMLVLDVYSALPPLKSADYVPGPGKFTPFSTRSGWIHQEDAGNLTLESIADFPFFYMAPFLCFYELIESLYMK